jgi:uncharacterized protein with ATP-grasp and redox domains
MHTYLDCYPCFVRQALEAARQLGASERKQKIVLERVLEALRDVDLSFTPPQIGDQVHRLVRQELGDGDPYRTFKERATRETGYATATLKGKWLLIVLNADSSATAEAAAQHGETSVQAFLEAGKEKSP